MRLDQADRIMLGDREVSRVYLGANLVWGDAFSPASLFAQGEPGVWYDPSDFSTMFQDAAGTVPVTAVEQPVGRILDKSGRGFHATQATATSRPVLRQDGNGKYYLYFDGVDDFLVTPTITPGIDKAQVFAGVMKLKLEYQAQAIVELGSNSFGTNGISVFSGGAVSNQTNEYSTMGFASAGYGRDYAVAAIPSTDVLTALFDVANPVPTSSQMLRANGASAAGTQVAGTNMGAGNFLQNQAYIGRRGGITRPFNGYIYSLIVRFGSNLPIETIEKTEAWINGKTGAY